MPFGVFLETVFFLCSYNDKLDIVGNAFKESR